jgi:hypothetical protein
VTRGLPPPEGADTPSDAAGDGAMRSPKGKLRRLLVAAAPERIPWTDEPGAARHGRRRVLPSSALHRQACTPGIDHVFVAQLHAPLNM